jgi:hypothetical protein
VPWRDADKSNRHVITAPSEPDALAGNSTGIKQQAGGALDHFHVVCAVALQDYHQVRPADLGRRQLNFRYRLSVDDP